MCISLCKQPLSYICITQLAHRTPCSLSANYKGPATTTADIDVSTLEMLLHGMLAFMDRSQLEMQAVMLDWMQAIGSS